MGDDHVTFSNVGSFGLSTTVSFPQNAKVGGIMIHALHYFPKVPLPLLLGKVKGIAFGDHFQVSFSNSIFNTK
jgi:hypothetical protein